QGDDNERRNSELKYPQVPKDGRHQLAARDRARRRQGYRRSDDRWQRSVPGPCHAGRAWIEHRRHVRRRHPAAITLYETQRQGLRFHSSFIRQPSALVQSLRHVAACCKSRAIGVLADVVATDATPSGPTSLFAERENAPHEAMVVGDRIEGGREGTLVADSAIGTFPSYT